MRNPFIYTLLILCVAAAAASAIAPTLTLTEDRRGSWEFMGTEEPPVVVDDLAGCPDVIPWVVSWQATANGPGVSVTEFRYGWDITDPDDQYQWEIGWTEIYSAPPRSFFFGTHVLMVEARDDAGEITRGTIVVNIQNTNIPTLSILEATRGEWIFVGLDGPVVTLTDPVTDPVTPWAFDWDAMSCNLDIDAYRYGWDIADPDDDSQWSPWGDFIVAPPQEFTAGVHTFMVEAKDTAGVVTRGTIVFEVIGGPVPVQNTSWGRIKVLYIDR